MLSRTVGVALIVGGGIAFASGEEGCPIAPDFARSGEMDTTAWIAAAREDLEQLWVGYPYARTVVRGVRTEGEEGWRWNCIPDRGDRYLIAPLVNRGKSRSADRSLERMAGRFAGKEWSPDALERMEKRLLRSGYFQKTALSYWEPVERRRLLRPVLSLEDLPIRTLELQLQGDEGETPSGFFILDWGNLFGTGRDLRIGYFSWDEGVTEMEGRYKEPDLFRDFSLRIGGGFRIREIDYSRKWGEAGVEWRGERGDIAFYYGEERVLERFSSDSSEHRQSRWGKIGGEVDLPSGGVCGGELTRYYPDNRPEWLRWNSGCQTSSRWKESPFSLRHRWKIGGRWPWRAGRTEEGLFEWGGIGSLRGYRERQLRSVAFGILSLQPEWDWTSRWSTMVFLDGGWDWTASDPADPVSRYGYGGGGVWSSRSVRVSIAVAWKEGEFSRKNALLLLGWDNRF